VLSGLDWDSYNTLNERYLSVSVGSASGAWCALDGKELKGNIDGVAGQRRGLNLVRALCHEGKESTVVGFYDGSKKSEKTTVINYLEDHLTPGAGYSMDALHTSCGLLRFMHIGGAVYLAQVKANQKLLMEALQEYHLHWPPAWGHQECEKGHGRVETRKAYAYSLEGTMEEKWQQAGLQTLMAVERTRLRVKDGKQSSETAFFVSNKALAPETAMELFRAVRNHWAIEADHWVRDVTFGEDRMRCSCPKRAKGMASVLNTALNIIRKNNTLGSIQLFREQISEDWGKALSCLRKQT